MRFILYLLIFAAAEKIGKTAYTKASDCVSSFVYKGQTYTDCTEVDSPGKPWCSLDAIYIIGSGRYRYCTPVAVLPNNYVQHPDCVFPFLYKNTEYNKCTKTDANDFWCSKTKVYSGQWEYCPRKPNEYVPANIQNHPRCKFPFIYNNVIYKRCTKADYHKYWCSLTKTYIHGSNQWVLCPKSKWIIVQRRINGAVSFERRWEQYKNGFGNLFGNFWIGNEKLHQLTNGAAPMMIRFDLWDKNNVYTYAEYSTFHVDSENNNYKLTISGHSGTAPDAMSYHNNMEFSTRDRDNDQWAGGSCSIRSGNAGWWFKSCYKVNLNSLYYPPGTPNEWKSILWNSWVTPYSLTKVVMRIAYK